MIDVPEARHLGMLPLHCCAAGPASPAAIAYLLKVYPPAASALDAAGRFPLHHAVSGPAPDESVTLLLEAHPDAAQHADHSGQLPLALALRHRPNESAVVRQLVDAYPDAARAALSDFMRSLNLSLGQVVGMAVTEAMSQTATSSSQHSMGRPPATGSSMRGTKDPGAAPWLPTSCRDP